MTKYLLISAIIAAMGGFLNGYDTGVISGAILFIEKSFQITPAQLGLLVSSISFGAVIGAFLNGFIIDRIGRKNTILLSALFFFIGSILCFLSKNINMLIFSRVFTGIAVGVVSFAVPLYLSEISSKENRGKIVSFFQVAITLGILGAYFTNYCLSGFNDNWRFMLLFGAIPALILLLGFLFQKDTPRWLILKNRKEEAVKILEKLHNKPSENEIKEIESTVQNNDKIKFSKKLIKPFVIGIGMMFVQICTGINAIIYFTPTIFKHVGFDSDSNALFITIFIGVINFLMTFVAVAFVDKLGRKPLLYIGLSGMIMSLAVLSLSFNYNTEFIKYFAVGACCIYIISFSMSLGPIALLLISEVFPLKFRGQAMSIAIIFNFIFNFITTGLFPIFMDKFGGFITFNIFNLICILSIIFIFTTVPETKGISLEELEKKYPTID